MTILTTVTALQAIHTAISGIKSAPTTMPSNLSTAVLPIALVFPGKADWDMQAIDLKRQDRDYVVRVYVAPISQDLPFAGLTTCLTLLNLFGAAYLTRANLDLSGAVDHIGSITDTGVINIETDPNTKYWGFEFTLTITEKTT